MQRKLLRTAPTGMLRGLLVIGSIAIYAQTAQAFGIGDLVSIGVQAGGKLVGAAVDVGVDKAKEALRDPEAEAAKEREEKRKVAERFEKSLAEIEAKKDLTPLQREKYTRLLQKQFENIEQFKQFVAQAEASQKEQRSQIFTGAGLASVIGEAAMSAPSIATAQASAMAKSPAYRAQLKFNTDAALRQADASVAAGIPQAQIRTGLAQVDMLGQGGKSVEGTIENVGKIDVIGTPPTATTGLESDTEPQTNSPDQTDAFTVDLGKSLYVEFVGSEKHSEVLRNILRSKGHAIVATKVESDVAYIFDGEFTVAESKESKGVVVSVGEILANPAKPVPAPEKKVLGSLGLNLNKFLLTVAQAQGTNVPQAMMQGASGASPQQVLLVAARQPKDGKETRLSVVRETASADIQAEKLSKQAVEDLYARLGVGS